jgi:hypothetical protein
MLCSWKNSLKLRILRLEPATLATSGFDSGFDWTTKLQKSFVVGKFIDGRLAGLIAFRRVPEDLSNYVDLLEVAKPFRHRHIASKLLAIVMLDSQHQPNFGGFVQLTTKFNGVENFYFHLHGDLFGNKFFFYEDVSQSLVKQYLPQGGFIQWMSPQSNND